MYWTENWKEQTVPTSTTINGTKMPGGSKGNGVLLDKIIQGNDAAASAERPLRVKFPTPAFESRFKSCLAQVPVSARIEGEGRSRALLLRPKNVQQFDDLIRTSGLGNCEAATKSVEWLKTDTTRFLRYETH